MKITRLVGCGIAATVLASGQQSLGSPSFEVASVKVDTTDPLPTFVAGRGEMRMRFQGGPGTRTPERIDYRAVTLRMLIQRAYAVEPYQVTGPPWLDKQRYTIMAKLPGRVTHEQCRAMLRNLLSERFGLRMHSEARPFRVYRLVVSKEGAKLKPALTTARPGGEAEALADVASNFRAEQGKTIQGLGFKPTNHLFSTRDTVQEFADNLSQYVDRPVIDATHLEGPYSFSLAWVADGTRQEGDQPYGPSLVEALRKQLGLALRSAEDRLPVFVVDAAERIPVEN